MENGSTGSERACDSWVGTDADCGEMENESEGPLLWMRSDEGRL